MFTQKHYEKIADTLIKANVSIMIVIYFMDMFEKDSKKFDRTKFITYVLKGWHKK